MRIGGDQAVTRPIAVVLALGSALAMAISRLVTRPMPDSSEYRIAAGVLGDGWPALTSRTPGYPLLLLVTGSSGGETHLLYLAQLAMHLAAVLLVVGLAHRVVVSARLRLVMAVLLMAPPVTEMARYAGSEVLAELLVVVAVRGWFAWREDGRTAPLAGAGCAVAASGLVRPGMAPLVVLLGAAVLLRRAAAPSGAVLGRWLAAAVLPGVVLLGGLSLVNSLRFDQPGLTPLLPYHLSTRTAAYVEELPASEEPLRSVLVARRDRELAVSEGHVPWNYVNRPGAPEAVGRATGLTRPELDRELLRLDLVLIVHHPIEYLDQVLQASNRIWQYDAYAGGLGSSGPVGWAATALHLALAGWFAFVTMIAGAAAFRRAFRGPAARLWGACLAVAALNALVSVAVEVGSPRLRTPTDALLVLALVIATGVTADERGAAKPPT